jgi:hypothetical protein
MRLPIAVGVAALMFLTTGCKEGQEAAEMLPHLSDDQAKEIVAAYAEEALRISGLAGYSRSALSPSPCEGRRGEYSHEVYSIQGVYQLIVPGPEQQRVIDRVRDGWRSLRYTITWERSFGRDRGGQVRATNPVDGAQFSLSTGELPVITLAIHTGCYRRSAAGAESTA